MSGASSAPRVEEIILEKTAAGKYALHCDYPIILGDFSAIMWDVCSRHNISANDAILHL